VITLPLDQIQIAERIRKEFSPEDIESLAEDIFINGLYHPPVVRQEGYTYHLVAGERRIRAITSLLEAGGWFRFSGTTYDDMVPCNLIGELSDEQQIEVELNENLLRVDLSWQERAQAVARLHELRTRQRGGVQSVAATAQELGDSSAPNAGVQEVRDSLLVTRFLEVPEVAAAPTVRAAAKAVDRHLASERGKIAATLLKKQPSGTLHRIEQGDAIALLQGVHTASIDCVLTDPPYGVNAHEFREQATISHGYSDTPEEFLDLVQRILPELSRVCKPDAHLYWFCDTRWFPFLFDQLKANGWTPWHVPIIWSKGPSFGALPVPDFAPRRTYEPIIYAYRGKKRVLEVRPDVVTVQPVSSKLHGAQKPVALYEDLLARSCHPGETVLDPFCGSGTIIPACNRRSLRAVAFDINPTFVGYAALRSRSTDDVIPTEPSHGQAKNV
jgi:site-specific DNA-methyltransferase (adenine-specific)